MTGLIDLEQFRDCSGALDLLPLVGAAFLRQLPHWQTAFLAATESHDVAALVELLHKMKGSCHAIAAHDVARQFELAEQSIKHIVPVEWRMQKCALLKQIQQIKIELQTVIAAQNAK